MANLLYSYHQQNFKKSEIKLHSFQILKEFLDEFNGRLSDVTDLFAYSNGELDFRFKDLDGRWYHIHMFQMVKSLERMIESDKSVIYMAKHRKYYFQLIY